MGWSIEQAADELGVDPANWSRWEGGRPNLYRRHRKLIASICDANQVEFESQGSN
ncbi:helix-turn-helix domain-containing protein [Elongatibacter sediminis]|uniref:helix-turn-helix domain-containing protein n=1 Tax=Elongatibacter sediminis TaxID=3119006 RepID=UPI00339D8F9F